jgi:hypothetical protein
LQRRHHGGLSKRLHLSSAIAYRSLNCTSTPRQLSRMQEEPEGQQHPLYPGGPLNPEIPHLAHLPSVTPRLILRPTQRAQARTRRPEPCAHHSIIPPTELDSAIAAQHMIFRPCSCVALGELRHDTGEDEHEPCTSAVGLPDRSEASARSF